MSLNIGVRAVSPISFAAALILAQFATPASATTVFDAASQAHGDTHAGTHADGELFSISAPVEAANAARRSRNGRSKKIYPANTREKALDRIFSQSSFGDHPIDIRFNPLVELAAPSLVKVTTRSEINELFSLTPPMRTARGAINKTISLYYVQSLDFCSFKSRSIVGCGKTPGNQIAVEAKFAGSSRYGAELLGHELGHALNLFHAGKAPTYSARRNLMAGRLNGSTAIDSMQVSMLFGEGRFSFFGGSSLIQKDQQGYFVEISPYFIVSRSSSGNVAGLGDDGNDSTRFSGTLAPVPLPGAGALLLSGLAAMAGIGRIRRSA